jgi:CBS domain-containing protein
MNTATILDSKGHDVITATPNTSLIDIANILAQYCIGCIVIVDDEDKVRGIFSEHDLIRAIGQGGPQVLKIPVSKFMTTAVITARNTDTYDQLMSGMTTQEFRYMPVVEMDRLIGIVSIGDLVKMHVADVELESTELQQHISTCGRH